MKPSWSCVILLDLAVQAVHVTNQAMILAARAGARSRLVGGYMVAYSLGSGLGSIAATQIHAVAGWTGICLLGAGISAAALVFWAGIRKVSLNKSEIKIIFN